MEGELESDGANRPWTLERVAKELAETTSAGFRFPKLRATKNQLKELFEGQPCVFDDGCMLELLCQGVERKKWTFRACPRAAGN